MTIILKLNKVILSKNISHNLKKIILSKLTTSYFILNNKLLNGLLNKMEQNPTALCTRDGCTSDDSWNSIPGTSRHKESKYKKHEEVVNNNIRYRHTRFTRSYNRSLPDNDILQNNYLYRKEENVKMERHYSTGDVRRKRDEHENTKEFRRWIPVNVQQRNPLVDQVPGLEFKLMNYNVLAQDLLTEHAYLYKEHSPAALLWHNRWKNLHKEITEHNADIICLQEIQEDHIKEYYQQIIGLGYGSIYKKRTGARTDGCALYYRKSMFTLLDYITIEYFQPTTSILDRENVGIVALLAPINNPNSKFVVATTHLLYNPRRQDVRVAQTQVLLAEIERMAYKSKNSQGQAEYYPLIITGDFNSEPDSAVVELIKRGELKYDLLQNRTLKKMDQPRHDLNGRNGKELIPPFLRITDQCQHLDLLQHRSIGAQLSRYDQEKLISLHNSNKPIQNRFERPKNSSLFSTGKLTHQFKIKSAFKHKIGNDTEGTTFQNAWISVDYIFYSTEAKDKSDGKLKLLSRFTIPTTKQLTQIKTIPNFVLGSDHLALLTKFKLEY